MFEQFNTLPVHKIMNYPPVDADNLVLCRKTFNKDDAFAVSGDVDKVTCVACLELLNA